MTFIEIGGMASAILAIITLITKLVQLISTIQNLIHQLKLIQTQLTIQQTKSNQFDEQMQKFQWKLQCLERGLDGLIRENRGGMTNVIEKSMV